MITTLRRRILRVLTIAVLVWWMVLLVSNTRAFLRGDRFAGVLALIIFATLVGGTIAGVAGYRRFQREWKKLSNSHTSSSST